MTKADKIRAALAGGKKLSKAQIEAAIAAKIPNITAALNKTEIASEGPSGDKKYFLNPDYTAGDKPKRGSKRHKRMKGHMALKREREKAKGNGRIKSLADIRIPPAASTSLALDNLLGAGELLRNALRDQVDGIDDDPLLAAIIKNHERAEQLVRGA